MNFLIKNACNITHFLLLVGAELDTLHEKACLALSTMCLTGSDIPRRLPCSFNTDLCNINQLFIRHFYLFSVISDDISHMHKITGKILKYKIIKICLEFWCRCVTCLLNRLLSYNLLLFLDKSIFQ